MIGVLTISTAAQTVSYDKFKDSTTVRSGEIRPEITNEYRDRIARVIVVVTATYNGETMAAEPGTFFLMANSISENWTFLRARDGIVLADDKRIQLGEADRASSILRGHVSETLGWPISRDNLARLANAKTVEMKIGFVQIKFTEKDLAAMRGVLAAATKSN